MERTLIERTIPRSRSALAAMFDDLFCTYVEINEQLEVIPAGRIREALAKID